MKEPLPLRPLHHFIASSSSFSIYNKNTVGGLLAVIGKGLGKHENGISEALKPKLKRSVAGVGHDPAAEFNEHWWSTLYDKASKNLQVVEKNGKTKKIKTKDDDEFVITNSTWKLNKKQKESNNEQYSDYFVRTAVLDNGENRVETVREPSDDEEKKGDVFQMTDEQLYAACEGRTAHKGARHGLRATGKLARIAQQEAMLLSQSKYSGYSHAKKLKDTVVEDMNLNSDTETIEHKKKKKKRKRCNSNENQHEGPDCVMAEPVIPLRTENNVTGVVDVTSVRKEKITSKRSKKLKKKDFRDIDIIPEDNEESYRPKKKRKSESPEYMETSNNEDIADHDVMKTKKSKKKNKT
ncbi:unnamed protein product [Chrysodeixis includens]|uniref:G patch domain-containing protein 4 n=1 Tax=Chrysodeixis includens TaxID=689277 RepID=A0A9N8L844_CHRIL|nr:unnamed protein product [Chrysodeixis includens]